MLRFQRHAQVHRGKHALTPTLTSCTLYHRVQTDVVQHLCVQLRHERCPRRLLHKVHMLSVPVKLPRIAAVVVQLSSENFVPAETPFSLSTSPPMFVSSLSWQMIGGLNESREHDAKNGSFRTDSVSESGRQSQTSRCSATHQRGRCNPLSQSRSAAGSARKRRDLPGLVWQTGCMPRPSSALNPPALIRM